MFSAREAKRLDVHQQGLCEPQSCEEVDIGSMFLFFYFHVQESEQVRVELKFLKFYS